MYELGIQTPMLVDLLLGNLLHHLSTMTNSTYSASYSINISDDRWPGKPASSRLRVRNRAHHEAPPATTLHQDRPGRAEPQVLGQGQRLLARVRQSWELLLFR